MPTPPPVIGITTSVVPPNLRGAPERAQLNASYIAAVQGAGGAPLLLPPQLTPEALAVLLETVDGLVLTGGGDVDPARYGEPPHQTVEGVSDQRDTLEIAAVHFALEREVPVLAICRGMQVLNVALGGSLVQDIPSSVDDPVEHRETEPRQGPAHDVMVQPGSKLAALVGTSPLQVNSRHHQAVKQPARGLTATAWAPDGVIEGMELPGDAFVVAVQWHPEDMVEACDHARRLFAGLIAAATRPV